MVINVVLVATLPRKIVGHGLTLDRASPTPSGNHECMRHPGYADLSCIVKSRRTQSIKIKWGAGLDAGMAQAPVVGLCDIIPMIGSTTSWTARATLGFRKLENQRPVSLDCYPRSERRRDGCRDRALDNVGRPQ
jgi:hypothetical protein